MPAYESAFPVGITDLELRDTNGVTYPIIIGTHTFTRTGKDGAEVIFQLFSGDEFIGEILEGGWRKAWDSNMSVFTAHIDGGNLELTGVSVGPPAYGTGWITNANPIVLVDTLEIVYAEQAPVDDTGAVAAKDIFTMFYIGEDNDMTDPHGDNNYFRVIRNIDEFGTKFQLTRNVNGSVVTYAEGWDYTMDTTWGTGDIEACIWRFVFHGKVGTVNAHMHIYLKQGATIATIGSENEITGSPFDTDTWAVHVMYPSLRIQTQNSTYFGTEIDSANAHIVGYIRVTYPDFNHDFKVPEANKTTGDVQLWDARGETDETLWQQVLDRNHDFVGDPILQNGLIRAQITELGLKGFVTSCYTGADYTSFVDEHSYYLGDAATQLTYPDVLSIEKLTPEKISLKVRFRNSETANEDYYLDAVYTLKRGSYGFIVTSITTFPVGSVLPYWAKADDWRFAYVGDDKIADDDIGGNVSNTNLPDNFMIGFDPEQSGILAFVGTSQKPTDASSEFESVSSSWLVINSYSPSDLTDLRLFLGVIPFSDIANLFIEAEDATISAATRSYLDGEGNCVDSVCEAQPNRVGGIPLDGDDFNFWAVNDCVVSQETAYGLKMEGTESSKIVVSGTPTGAWYIRHVYGGGQDWSGEDFIGFWWYGQSSGDTIALLLRDTDVDQYLYDWVDDFTGWKWVAFDLATFIANGVDVSIIDNFQISCESPSGSVGLTYYVDFPDVYTVNADTLWSSDGDSTVDVSNTAEAQVGVYCVAHVATATAACDAFITLTNGMGNLLKFDFIKMWLHSSFGVTSIRIMLTDTDGDSIYKNFNIDGTPTEYSLEIPHSAADLVSYGWTDTATFDFATFTSIRMRFTSGNIGEAVYYDGIQFYIGTTTTRGRGETLSGGEAVVFDANAEFGYNPVVVGTNLPAGEYLLVQRVKDTDQVASDFKHTVWNQTDSERRNEEGEIKILTLTGSFAYRGGVFFISDADVSGTNTFWVGVPQKATATENTIFLDYYLLIPLSNGKDWPMDLAHNALYKRTKIYDVYEP